MMRRVLFLGQKWLGERCFDLLLGAPGAACAVVAAVSNATPEVWWRSQRIVERCHREGIPFLGNATRQHEAIGRLVIELGVDTILCVQHPWILPPEILSRVGFQAFNLHNAPLPRYKGHNACNHAILNGERAYASTVHWMTEEVDSGPIAFEEPLEIAPDETARSLYEKALHGGEGVFRRLLDHLLGGTPIPRRPMVGDGVFYPRRSLDAVREIADLADPATVDRRVRALFFPPFEPAYVRRAGRKQYLLPATFADFATEFDPARGFGPEEIPGCSDSTRSFSTRT